MGGEDTAWQCIWQWLGKWLNIIIDWVYKNIHFNLTRYAAGMLVRTFANAVVNGPISPYFTKGPAAISGIGSSKINKLNEFSQIQFKHLLWFDELLHWKRGMSASMWYPLFFVFPVDLFPLNFIENYSIYFG